MTTEHRKEQLKKASAKYRILNGEKALAASRASKKKWIEQRRCTSCATPLLPDELKTCMNCCGNTKKEFTYAKNQAEFNRKII